MNDFNGEQLPTKATIKSINSTALSYSSLKGISETIRSRIRVSSNSFYEDNIWDLSEEHPNLAPVSVKMKFSLINFSDGSDITMPGCEEFLKAVKEYAYSLIVDPPASHPKWTTSCTAIQKGIKSLIRFMRESEIYRFSQLTKHDFSKFLSEITGTCNRSGAKLTNRTLRSRVYAISWLYEQSHKLSDGLNTWPFLDSNSETEWCEDSAEELIPRAFRTTPEMPDRIAAELLQHAVADLNIIETIEAIRLRLAEHKPKKKQTKTRLPCGGSSFVVKRLNPFPWETWGMKSQSGLRHLEVTLASACYIIIAMLTGMRFHEILHIRHGRSNNWNIKKVYSNNTERNFYFLLSKTNKLQAHPTAYSWQTLPIVERALDALERCFSHRHTSGNPYLFASAITGGRMSESSIAQNLRDYPAHHNIMNNGLPWELASHQFRKKFARIMIRQGLGLVALQDQLKHFDIEMTKVYGDMNIYTELQQEKFVLSTEKYEELLSNNSPIIGGGAQEILQYRKVFTGMTKAEQKAFLETLPKNALIEQVDDGLCIFRPSKALCGGEKINCRPADCNNAILPANSMLRTLVWRKTENIRILRFFIGQPLKVAHINERIGEINKLLLQLDAQGEVDS